MRWPEWKEMEDAGDASGWVFELASIFWVESPTEQPQEPRVIQQRHTWAIPMHFDQTIGEKIQPSADDHSFPEASAALNFKFANSLALLSED